MMLHRIGLYVRTASHLRPDQLAHIFYRLAVPRSRPRAACDSIRLRERAPLGAKSLFNSPFDDAHVVDGVPTKHAGAIDWQCPSMSRLRRYHLHYFDFLNDPARSAISGHATIADWIGANPAGTPDAWDPYPVSLRIVNWIKYFDRERECVSERALRSLYEQTLWLESNLERRVLANHYLKNGKALVFAGLFFDGADAERWRKAGFDIFVSEAREQFLADGGHYERSPMYHVICLEDLLDVINVAMSTSTGVAREPTERLRATALRALRFLDSILMPDGAIPLFNDAAFGVGPEPADVFAYARAVVGYRRPQRDLTLSIRSLDQSGYYVIRDDEDMLAIDCGELGPPYQPGHAHADCLSYELALNGERVVVDSGVCDYEVSASRRYARSTAAHNTVTVDGHDQSEMWGVFRVGRRARPISPELRLRAFDAIFAGAHDGFLHLGDGIIHRRTVRHRNRYWVFEDFICGHGDHRIESRIHLAPHLRARVGEEAIEVYGRDGNVRATITTSRNVSIEVAEAPYFPHFGKTEKCNVIVLTYCAALPVTLSYTIEGVARHA